MECQRGLATRKVSLKRVKCNKRDMFYVLLEVTVQQSAVAALGVGCVLSNYSSLSEGIRVRVVYEHFANSTDY